MGRVRREQYSEALPGWGWHIDCILSTLQQNMDISQLIYIHLVFELMWGVENPGASSRILVSKVLQIIVTTSQLSCGLQANGIITVSTLSYPQHTSPPPPSHSPSLLPPVTVHTLIQFNSVNESCVVFSAVYLYYNNIFSVFQVC